MIKDNILQINENIDNLKNKIGIKYHIDLMAVSKTFPLKSIIEAIHAGQILFGENRVLEAYEKFKIIFDKYNNMQLHIIGHLQRNKVKEATDISACIQSIDKIETLDVIEKRCEILNKKMDFLIEINTSNESQKNGIFPQNISKFLEEIQNKKI